MGYYQVGGDAHADGDDDQSQQQAKLLGNGSPARRAPN